MHAAGGCRWQSSPPRHAAFPVARHLPPPARATSACSPRRRACADEAEAFQRHGGSFQRLELPANTRAHGILGEGALLTRHALADRSSPVQRGKLVRERLLCEELAPPPANVNTNLPVPTGAVTTRQRYEQHSKDPFCNGCHSRIDS